MRPNILFLSLLIFGCTDSGSDQRVSLNNPTDLTRNEVVTINLSNFDLDDSNIYLESENNSVPFEEVDKDQDGTVDRIRFLVKLDPNESKTIFIKSGNASQSNEPQKLTQAEISVKKGGEWQERKYVGGEFENVKSLRVPKEHTDHSNYIRYEGPGWESNRVGYRFYLDWRNGIDIFGKKTEEMVLQNVGQDNFDSYHEESDWGLDILKVGNTLGLGSIGRHQNDSLYRFQEVDSVYCEITENGLLRSSITTKYYNWKTEDDATDLTSKISIDAESRVTRHEVNLSNPISGFCTGLAINEDEEFIDISEGDYRLLATYGNFSLNDDQLGMAVIVKNEEVENVFDDEYSHVVTFKPLDKVTYYFLAAWEKEPEGITSYEEFEKYVRDALVKINNRIAVETSN